MQPSTLTDSNHTINVNGHPRDHHSTHITFGSFFVLHILWNDSQKKRVIEGIKDIMNMKNKRARARNSDFSSKCLLARHILYIYCYCYCMYISFLFWQKLREAHIFHVKLNLKFWATYIHRSISFLFCLFIHVYFIVCYVFCLTAWNLCLFMFIFAVEIYLLFLHIYDILYFISFSEKQKNACDSDYL